MTPQQKSRPGAGTAYATTRSNDSPIDAVLHRLEKVKSTGPGKWQALCPAHDDKRPSLSIREADDGKVLLKCWSGCSAQAITEALGLSLADLFPGDRRSHESGTGSMRRPFDYRDCLTGIAHEATVARLIVEAVNRGEAMDVESLDRLALAEERISDALAAAGGVQ
ncbi:MAG: hypothetical protein PHG39_09655 [Acidithiobacillus ferrooxidans]|jgi:hypothetical protein|uniref:Uncharacterized protein n=1 Tax=Acidithiobacillus ferruginosus TaxID=3063951 RepID=A0ACD5IJ13_9PROT|nr:hypothetical protein [Acidithiobacillus ferruginosus]MDD2747803.1 hypothetical protein [Acidithiobacillus ferrooxidans]MDD5002753.1 hypothetical protein [Acidithiobacillus sp.]MDD5377981.1 hypothetical protein [Acidithiobacillus sp.]MDD5576202.1 hypothetical protein [Acidithiobacillus sp.]